MTENTSQHTGRFQRVPSPTPEFPQEVMAVSPQHQQALQTSAIEIPENYTKSNPEMRHSPQQMAIIQEDLVQQYKKINQEQHELEQINMKYRFELDQTIKIIQELELKVQQQFKVSTLEDLESFIHTTIEREQKYIAEVQQLLNRERECQQTIENELKNIL